MTIKHPKRAGIGAITAALATLTLVAGQAFAHDLVKDMRELGTKIATAQACGIPADEMRGSMYRYTEEINLRSAVVKGAVHSYDEDDRTVTASEIKFAYIQGSQLMEKPTPKECKKFKKKWEKFDKKQLELGDKAYVEVSTVLAGG